MAKDGIKTVLFNSALYTFGNLLLKVFSFFLIPLYTTYLIPKEYGILNLANSFTAVLCVIMTLGLQTAVIRFYTDFKNEKIKLARMFGSVIISVSTFSLVFSTILYLTKRFWMPWFFDDVDFFPVVLLSIIISFVTALYTIYQDSLKGMNEGKRSMTMTYIFFFMLLSANLITVVRLRMGATGILLSTMIVNAIMVIVMLVDLRKRHMLVFCVDGKILKEMLKYSLPLVPHSMSYTISNFITRIIINTKMSLSSLGIYSLASQFGGVADIALNSVQSAFQPWIFSKLKDYYITNSVAIANEIKQTSYLLMWLSGLMYLIISAFSEEAVNLLAADDYHSAWIYIPAMVAAVTIKSPLYFYNNFLYFDKDKTSVVFISTLIGSIINILVTWWLVPMYGIYGSIAGDIANMIVRLTIIIPITYNLAKGIYSFINMTILSFIPIVFLSVAVIPSYFQIHIELWYNLGYKTLIIAVYICLILYLYKNKIFPNLKNLIHSK